MLCLPGFILFFGTSARVVNAKEVLINMRRRSFIGYQNANYALSEVKNPVLTLKNASVIGVSIVATTYVLVNIAYFAVVSKKDILDSSNVVV